MKTGKLKKEQMLILGLLGILLMVIAIPVPQNKTDGQTEHRAEEERETVTESMEVRLENVLNQISGVGKTKVFITYQDHGKLILEKDEAVLEELIQEEDGSGGTRMTTTRNHEQETVYDQDESPCIIQELMPKVEGVLIVAQGAGNEGVKKQIQEAMEALFGLEAHKISIMKMEVSK